MNLFFNSQIKIGIYIAKSLGGSRTYGVDNIPLGLKAIIKELDCSKFNYSYCDIKTINDYDFLLYSVNSDKDYLILIRDFYKKQVKPKIIVGGSDIINLYLLKDVVDIQVIGRAEGQINDIIEGREFTNVWRRENDYNIEKKYTIRQPQYLLSVGNRHEHNVGCNFKCKFCQYGNKFPLFIKNLGYNSGQDERELMFTDIDWNLAKSRVVTSIDGSTENSRMLVNKRLSNERIIKKITDAYNIKTKSPLLLSVYNIIGYPWEDKKTAELSELLHLLKQADYTKTTHKIWIDFRFNHFIPMLLTPFEKSALNIINFRELVFKKFGNDLFKGNNIQAKIFNGFPSVQKTADRLYVYRSFCVDYHILEMTKNKYYINSMDKRLEYLKECENIKEVQNLPSDAIIHNNA